MAFQGISGCKTTGRALAAALQVPLQEMHVSVRAPVNRSFTSIESIESIEVLLMREKLWGHHPLQCLGPKRSRNAGETPPNASTSEAFHTGKPSGAAGDTSRRCAPAVGRGSR